MSRRKGASAEREAANLIRDLTGWECKRRVRQHGNDSDLLGVPGWSIEVKRYATATRSQIEGWWMQAVEQAEGQIPVLLYRKDRDEWRAVWPISVHLTHQTAEMWTDYRWTCEGTVDAWAAVAREVSREG